MMSMKYFNTRGEEFVSESGKFLDISSDTFSDTYQCVTISGRFGNVFQITGVTVHEIVRSVLTNSSLRTKVAVRDWLNRIIDEETN